MKTQAVIDRFEGNKVVILVGKEQDRLIVPKTSIPKSAKVGDCLIVDVRDDRIISAEINTQATEATRNRVKDKLNKLRKGNHKTRI